MTHQEKRIYKLWYKKGLLGVFMLANGIKEFPNAQMPPASFATWRMEMENEFRREYGLTNGSEYGPAAAREHAVMVAHYWRWRLKRVARGYACIKAFRQWGCTMCGRFCAVPHGIGDPAFLAQFE